MTRVRLEYLDQNEGFAACLPRTGQVVDTLTSTAGVSDWYLVHIDDPISFQLKVGEAFTLLKTDHLLIRSRWTGKQVGEPEPTSVFLLLVDPSRLPLSSPIQVENFHHVAWGMCHTVPDAA